MKTSLPFKSGTAVSPVILLRQLRRGFSLIELTIAIAMGVAISGMIMVMFRQQLAFIDVYRTQNFLSEEAPVISMHVSKLIGKADSFRLHDSLADVTAGKRSALGANSRVVVLNYRQPDGTTRTSVLSFENLGKSDSRYDDCNALYYYVVPTNGLLGDPQWYITKKPQDVVFTMEQGVLRMKLTGPAGEEVTYSGTMQL